MVPLHLAIDEQQALVVFCLKKGAENEAIKDAESVFGQSGDGANEANDGLSAGHDFRNLGGPKHDAF